MLDFIFTVDYEIFGNGEGTLKDQVYEPAEKFREIFLKRDKRFVTFIEVAELEMISNQNSDPFVELTFEQIKSLRNSEFEIGLHIHPWWYNASYQKGKWNLDYAEYNLCVLPEERVCKIVDRALSYLRIILDDHEFAPESFRAGYLLFHPSKVLSNILADRGIRVDSSVYKGGLWHQHKLDYRKALKNDFYWKFNDDVNISDSGGVLLEFPIYSEMVPIWKMFTGKRISLQSKGTSLVQKRKKILSRFEDLMRVKYPLKLDLGQMTLREILRMMNNIIRNDQKTPKLYKPIVVLLHTKDPIDYHNFDVILSILEDNNIGVTTLSNAYNKVKNLIVDTVIL